MGRPPRWGDFGQIPPPPPPPRITADRQWQAKHAEGRERAAVGTRPSGRHAVGAHAGVDPAKRARAVVDALLSQESSDVAGAVDESGRTPV